MAHRARLDTNSVVEEAAKLVDEEGLEALSLSHLAARLGVRTPSLYNHIDGLPGLKRKLTLFCLRDLRDRATRATIGKARAEAIYTFAEAYLSFAREFPGRYTLTQIAPDPSDQEGQVLSSQLIDIIQAVLAPYKLSEEESIHAIRSLRSIVHGFASLEATGGFRMSINRDASFRWLVNLYIVGLGGSQA